MANPTAPPIIALAAIMISGISWVFDVASNINATKKRKLESSMVFLRPKCWSTNPAIKADRMAPKGGALAKNNNKIIF